MAAADGGAAGEATAALVVAHPDDEALWLSSVLADVGRVILCFDEILDRPQRSHARRAAVAALPVAGVVSIGLPESGVKLAVDWADPRPTRFGVAIVEPAARARYEDNYARLVDALRPALAGVSRVYTHNPWGEYGHAEHIQVHRAVMELQGALGYSVWFSNYVGRRSWVLARALRTQVLWQERREVNPDRAAARALMRVYRRHRVWTWSLAHRWPRRETLYGIRAEALDPVSFPMAGEWLLDADRLRWWPPSWRSVHRRL